MRILFMGTSDFAVASLDALVKAGRTPVAVISQPDKQRVYDDPDARQRKSG